MLSWQQDILQRYGTEGGQSTSGVESEIDRFSSKVAELSRQVGGEKDIRRLKLREPCLPCMKNRR